MFLEVSVAFVYGLWRAFYQLFFCKARDLLETMKFVKKQGLNYQLLKTADIGEKLKMKTTPLAIFLHNVENL